MDLFTAAECWHHYHPGPGDLDHPHLYRILHLQEIRQEARAQGSSPCRYGRQGRLQASAHQGSGSPLNTTPGFSLVRNPPGLMPAEAIRRQT